MSKAILLVLMLANHGYWFGGQHAAVTATWAVKADIPASVLAWQLTFSNVRIARGVSDVKSGDASTTLTLAMPEVRVATAMMWSYTLKRKDSATVIQSGELPIVLYPKKLFSDFSQRFGTRKLTIIDPSPELAEFLAASGIANTRFSDTSRLETFQADVLLVAPGALKQAALTQERLIAQATHGASIAVLHQDGENLVGYPLVLRSPEALSYRLNHPLLADMDAGEREALFRASGVVRAIALPTNATALDIVALARETSGDNPVPIDALLVTKTVGSGRIVLCQCPLDRPDQNPLVQIFYNNLFNYLLTRPEPTGRPSEHQTAAAPAAKPAPNLLPLIGESP